MAITTWGMLAKSQTDPEKIEEAIARIIAEHNESEEAHLGPGQSLQSHKAAEIIDHLVNSVIADKIKAGEITLDKMSMVENGIFTCFESLDGWSIATGGVSVRLYGLQIATTSTINNVQRLTQEPFGDSNVLDFSKSPFFQTSVRIEFTTAQLIYFIAGGLDFDETDQGFGFKVLNGTLYAIHIKSVGEVRTEYTTTITGITITNWNIYRAVYDYSAGIISFYVNGVLKVTHSTNLPVENHVVMMNYYVKTTAASAKRLYTKYLLWSKKQ